MVFKVNKSNGHLPNLFSNRTGAVKGLTVKSNHNIADWPNRDNPRPAQKGGRRRRTRRRGGRKRRRSSRHRRSRRRRSRKHRRSRKRRRSRRRARRQRGGGVYGFCPKGVGNWGNKGVNWSKKANGCGIASKSNLGVAKQHAPLAQIGGGPDSASAGRSIGQGGSFSYGFIPQKGQNKVNKDLRGSYAPMTRRLRPQCGSGKRRRKSRRRRKRRQRGGYHQYMSNRPLTPSLTIGGKANWTLANPPPFRRTDTCVDNYNHFKKRGSPSPVLDQAAP